MGTRWGVSFGEVDWVFGVDQEGALDAVDVGHGDGVG